MVRLACDGPGLLEAVRAAVANLEIHVDEINALNVFPVPDGDTGSNMLATCREMLAYVRDDTSVEAVADRLREGALFGARGNSGVILSQVVRGLAEGFAGKRRFNGLDLAHALATASTAAYGAVPRPVEGTMLTVIREASAVAVETAEHHHALVARGLLQRGNPALLEVREVRVVVLGLRASEPHPCDHDVPLPVMPGSHALAVAIKVERVEAARRRLSPGVPPCGANPG